MKRKLKMNVFNQINFARIGFLSLVFLGGLGRTALAANVTSLAALGANETIDWSVTHPVSAQSFTVNGITISEPSSIFKQLIQGAVGWAGNFPTGTYVEYDQEPSGPITFTFAAPVEGFGLTLNNDYGGAFTGTINEYDGATLLSSYTSAPQQQGTLLFLGVLDSSFDITSVTIDTAGIGGNHAFAFGNLSVVTTVATAPEPASVALLTMGLLGLSGLARRRAGLKQAR
jgi:hypothetical protein